jgi:hypothetical protein
MKWPHGREFQAMSGAPVKKLPASPGVGGPRVPVADRGSKTINVGFSDFGTGGSNQLRDPRLPRPTRPLGLYERQYKEYEYNASTSKTGMIRIKNP